MIKRITKYLSRYSTTTLAGGFTALTVLMAVTVVSATRAAPLERSIVKVTNDEGTGGGTGWVTKTSTGTRVIVTNDHVCQVSTGDYIRIDDDSGKSSIKRILRRDAARDLCVIEGVDVPALPLANGAPGRFEEVSVYGHPLLNPTTPSYGQYIADEIMPVAFSLNAEGGCDAGTPMGIQTPQAPPSFAMPYTDGQFIFGAPQYCVVFMELSYTSVPIFPGNSGSPVTNANGDVVGVMNSASSRDNRGNFIPLTYVKQILEDE